MALFFDLPIKSLIFCEHINLKFFLVDVEIMNNLLLLSVSVFRTIRQNAF